MKFHHLVQVNDPLQPLIEPLTPDQLWRGLVMKARDPLPFVYALDACTLLADTGTSVRRELRFGRTVIRDTITFLPPDRMRQDIEPSGEVPAATLWTTIEAPDALQLFVRFEYDTRPVAGAAPPDPRLEGFVKQAYVEADRDVIRTIRRLASEGRL
ncbi:MAG: DUF1857 family protein [Burkholderiales bacterium]|nr:DUF1857 family protein [Burkholderiales bacterium]